MQYLKPQIVIATALLLGLGTTASAATDDASDSKAEAAELHTQLEAEYKEALSAAEKERQLRKKVPKRALPNKQKCERCMRN